MKHFIILILSLFLMTLVVEANPTTIKDTVVISKNDGKVYVIDLNDSDLNVQQVVVVNKVAKMSQRKMFIMTAAITALVFLFAIAISLTE